MNLKGVGKWTAGGAALGAGLGYLPKHEINYSTNTERKYTPKERRHNAYSGAARLGLSGGLIKGTLNYSSTLAKAMKSRRQKNMNLPRLDVVREGTKDVAHLPIGHSSPSRPPPKVEVSEMRAPAHTSREKEMTDIQNEIRDKMGIPNRPGKIPEKKKVMYKNASVTQYLAFVDEMRHIFGA